METNTIRWTVRLVTNTSLNSTADELGGLGEPWNDIHLERCRVTASEGLIHRLNINQSPEADLMDPVE